MQYDYNLDKRVICNNLRQVFRESFISGYISGFLFDIFIKLSKNLALALVLGNNSWHILSKIYSNSKSLGTFSIDG